MNVSSNQFQRCPDNDKRGKDRRNRQRRLDACLPSQCVCLEREHNQAQDQDAFNRKDGNLQDVSVSEVSALAGECAEHHC